MRNNIRVSGDGILGKLPWGTHFCQFYQTKEDLLDTLVPYFKAGLENNEFCLWITSDQLNAEEAKKALRIVLPYFDTYIEKGQIEFIPYIDWYFKENVFDSDKVIESLIKKIKRALDIGYEGLRTTESFCWLEKENWGNLVDYEKKVDSVTCKYPVIALCTYFLKTFNVTSIMEIITNHQFVLSRKEGKWEMKESYGRKSIVECGQAEKNLHENEESYRLLFMHMTDGFGLIEVIYTDKGEPSDYRYLEINPAFGRFLGMDREHTLGRTMLEMFPNASSIALEKYHQVAVSGKPVHFEIFSEVADKYLDIYVFSPENGKLALIFRDITGRKLFEEQNRQRAEEMETIMEVTPVSILIGHDPEGNNITGNRMANELFNAKTGENISAKLTESLRFFRKGKELTADELPMREATVKNTDIRGAEVDVLIPGGKRQTILAAASPLHDEKGNVRGSVGSFIDITERKKAETKLKETLDNLEKLVRERTEELEKAYNSLKESEKGLAEAQKMAHIGNWEWEIVTEKSYWSDELYRIFGRSLQDPHPTYEEFLGYIHPDDREYVYNTAGKAMKGQPYSIEYKIIRADGKERTVHMQSEVIFDETNTPVRIKGIVQDITESKLAQQKIQESEERYRSFIENFKGIAFQADENFIPVFMHGTVEEITGYSEEEFISSQPWKKIIHPEDLAGISQEEEKIRNSPHKAYGEIDFRIIRKDGKIKWVHEIYQKIPGNDRTSDKYQGAIYDITERKKAEETLQKMEKIRIKEIHHRIKNNLQVISSLLDLQAETFSHLDTCKTPEVVEAFMESQNRVISMALIHEELYSGDKIDTLDFSAYLRKLTAELFISYNAGKKDISFKLFLEQIYLNMDTAIPLGIVINELVSNSFKHAFPAGEKGEIRINLRRSDNSGYTSEISASEEKCIQKSGFQYLLTVSDNGKGIQEELDFENSDSLGLQLVNILVEQIDGSIKLERDHGTKITILFNDLEI